MSDESGDLFTKQFFDWMVAQGLKPREIAKSLNKKEQTIHNWRSKGVPKSQRIACESVMERHDAGKVDQLVAQNAVFVIKPSYEQFQSWNQAALSEGKLIEDWAIEGLDRLADEAAERAILVADEQASWTDGEEKG